ncbi:MAG: orotidine-5'-phosphate decarboxylase [Acidimicrobiales bacterium]
MTTAEGVRPEVTSRLALALDVDDAVAANRLARELRPYFDVVKVGLELFTAAGPSIVSEMIDNGFAVFLDLKLADIPTTVERTARVLGALGVSYLTLHAFTGEAMLRAGVDGLADGAERAGMEAPRALAVTVLTSDAGAPAHILGNRVRAAAASGCAGVVCAAGDVAEAKSIAPQLLAVVPGIRPGGTALNDQARSATPEAALAAGADLLVIGRAVTAAADRQGAAQQLVGSLS